MKHWLPLALCLTTAAAPAFADDWETIRENPGVQTQGVKPSQLPLENEHKSMFHMPKLKMPGFGKHQKAYSPPPGQQTLPGHGFAPLNQPTRNGMPANVPVGLPDKPMNAHRLRKVLFRQQKENTARVVPFRHSKTH